MDGAVDNGSRMQLDDDEYKESDTNNRTTNEVTKNMAEKDAKRTKEDEGNYERVDNEISVEDDNSTGAAPLGLDAITGDGTISKSTQQDVINMLLAQHGIIPSSDSLDVTALNAHHRLALNAENNENRDDQKGSATTEVQLSSMMNSGATIEETTTKEAAPQSIKTESIELDASDQRQSEESHAYLSSIATSDIHEQIAANSGYEVTAFVAEDGQGRHIIISGGHGYQDSSVVSISGQQVVSTVTDNQLMTIASSDNSPVSMAGNETTSLTGSFKSDGFLIIEGLTIIEGLNFIPARMSNLMAFTDRLDGFGGDHVRIAPTDGDESDSRTSYYVLEGSVPMSNAQNEIESSDRDFKKVYQCTMDGCQKQFSTAYRLKAHGRAHTGKTFSCEEDGCHKSFITPSDLSKHSRTHTGDKPFFCSVEACGKVYSTAHHLKVHKRSHTGDKPFICEWESCGKSFSTGYGLKSHFRTHTGERPYKCLEEACDKAFKTSGDLQKHIRTHTGERPFKCLYEGCVRSFTTSNIRKVHMRTHTGERPYVCEIEGCGRSFASATNYKNHSRIHTGERPYTCEVPGCNKSFTEYSSLYKHNVVHTQQKPYVCNICDKTYRQTSTLAMHKRTVHGTDESNNECESNSPESSNQDLEPSSKRQKVSFDSNVALTTALVQGLPVMLSDEAGMGALQISDGSSMPGAIAIPIQVTVNPDGTIAGAQGISLTDGSGRMIPVSLSLTLPISSFANSLSETQTDDSIVTSEAVAAASAVNEIFSDHQQSDTTSIHIASDHVITEQIKNHDVISPDGDHTDAGVDNGEETDSPQVLSTEGMILLKTAPGTAHELITSDSESTSVRITPRNFSSGTSADLRVIEDTDGTDNVNRACARDDAAQGSAVDMIIDGGITHEQDEGDVTDRYLIKESLQVSERTNN
eukprot:gene18122-19932_t